MMRVVVSILAILIFMSRIYYVFDRIERASDFNLIRRNILVLYHLVVYYISCFSSLKEVGKFYS